MPTYFVDYISLEGINYIRSLKHPCRILINSLSDIYAAYTEFCVCVCRFLLTVYCFQFIPRFVFTFISPPFLSPYHVCIVNILRIHFARKLCGVLLTNYITTTKTASAEPDTKQRYYQTSESLIHTLTYFVSPTHTENSRNVYEANCAAKETIRSFSAEKRKKITVQSEWNEMIKS